MATTVFVRSATKDRHVALSEGDSLHPTGEAWVVGYPDLPDGSDDPANVVEVGLTALVRQKLAAGDLIEVARPMAQHLAAKVEPQDVAAKK